MSDLFGRVVEVQVGTEGDPAARALRDLRVSFRVEMDRTSTPNRAVIQVYNPAEATVGVLREADAVVRLLAGYESAGGPRQVFTGTPIRNGVGIERRGPDRLLTIEALDGGRAVAGSFVSESFAQQTSVGQVLDALAAALGLPRGATVLDSEIRWPQGLVLLGPVRDELDRVCGALAADWFVRDGALYVVARDRSTGEVAPLFAASRGNLIGSPVRKADGTVEVVALLDPAMRPGRPFVVQSEAVSGEYIARDVVFEGDSGWDASFYVRLTGEPRAGAL